MDQPQASAPLDYIVQKIRTVPDPAAGMERSRAWLALRTFQPGIEPCFMGSLWFFYDGRADPRGPSLQLIYPPSPTGGPSLLYLNLFFDARTGGCSLLNRAPGWRRIDFVFALPPSRAEVLVRAVVERPGEAGVAFHDCGRIGVLRGAWQFTSSSQSPFSAPEPPRLRPGFVGGAPKSGTTWMQLMLNQHPDVFALGEGSMLRNVTVRPWVFANAWYPPKMPQAALNDFGNHALLTRTLQLFREFSGCGWVVDKSPGNARQYRRILLFLPQAKLIHCVRHPLDVLLSRLHHEASIFRGGSPSPEMTAHVDAVGQLPGMLATAGTLVLTEPVWALLEKILDEYAEFQDEALATLSERPGKLLVIRYEDMLARPEKGAIKAFAHLGVPTTADFAAECTRSVSFENLLEKRKGAEHPFFRSGTSGQYETRLAHADRARIMTYLRSRLPQLDQFGYAS